MDGVQLPQGLSHFEEAVYFLPQVCSNCLNIGQDQLNNALTMEA